jgi:hypothetical protein
VAQSRLINGRSGPQEQVVADDKRARFRNLVG